MRGGVSCDFLCVLPEQVVKWLRLINEALEQQKLLPGVAMKLAGKLYWGSSCAFKRLGRAMIRWVVGGPVGAVRAVV